MDLGSTPIRRPQSTWASEVESGRFYRAGLATSKVTVRPSVCLSVKRVDCDKTEESSAEIFIP